MKHYTVTIGLMRAGDVVPLFALAFVVEEEEEW